MGGAWGGGSAPPHCPRSHLHLDLSGHLGRGVGEGSGSVGQAGASTAHQPRRKCPARQCQSRLLAQPCLVLGQDKGRWNRLPSTSQSSLPEAGAKDGGREEEDREEAGQSHTESVLSSTLLPFTSRESHSWWRHSLPCKDVQTHQQAPWCTHSPAQQAHAPDTLLLAHTLSCTCRETR